MAANPTLAAIASNMPAANQEAAKRRQAASDLQLQQAVAATPTTAPIQQTAQAMGTAVAQQQGQQQVQTAQKQVEQQAQAAGTVLKQQEAENKQATLAQNIGLQKTELSNEERFASLNQQAKTEMFDSRLKFEQDEAGRTIFNTRQLADYARLRAKDDVEYSRFEQKARQASERELQAMQQTSALLEEELNHRYNSAKSDEDRKLVENLRAMKIAHDKKMAQSKANYERDMAAIGVVAKVAGVVASIYSGPAGGAAAEAAVMGVGGAAVKEEDYYDTNRRSAPVYEKPSDKQKQGNK